MTDLMRAVELLPRYNRSNAWRPEGELCLVNVNMLPANTYESIARRWRLGGKTFRAPSTTAWVDVSGKVFSVQRALRYVTLRFFIDGRWKWQRWRRDRLPILLIYRGRTIIWNGTHRIMLCRLAGRRVRALVINLDAGPW